MPSTIDLKAKGGTKEFGLEQAAGILALEARHGFGDYSLPDDSKFEFVDGALKRKGAGTANPAQQPNS